MVSDIKTVAQKGFKIAAAKKFFRDFFFFISSLCLNVFLSPLPEVGCPKILEIRNPWGKVMDRSGLTFEIFCLELVRIAAQFFFYQPLNCY